MASAELAVPQHNFLDVDGRAQQLPSAELQRSALPMQHTIDESPDSSEATDSPDSSEDEQQKRGCAVWSCCCGDSSHAQLLEESVRSSSLPAEIRLQFILKVYGILFSMIALSACIDLPFVLRPGETKVFMSQHVWITHCAVGFLVIQQVANYIMLGCACGGDGTWMRRYIRMFATFPVNYAYLFTYAACLGVVLGPVLASYEASSVGLVFALTAGMMIVLSAYAVVTNADFTTCGPYILVALCSFLMLLVVGCFIPGKLFHKMLAVIGTMIFSFLIVHDTQLILGTAKKSVTNSAVGRLQFSIDMYAFAAFQLYLDFVNLFLQLLKLLGSRDS